MYSVTGLQFSYTQAPESMRSVLQGCWQLTVAVGNLIVTIIVGAKFFNSQVYEFALFAGLMFVDMGREFDDNNFIIRLTSTLLPLSVYVACDSIQIDSAGKLERN